MITRFLTARFSYRLILLMLLATIPAMLGGHLDSEPKGHR